MPDCCANRESRNGDKSSDRWPEREAVAAETGGDIKSVVWIGPVDDRDHVRG